MSEPGNFEGHNILNLPKTIELCAKLKQRDPNELRARTGRRPGEAIGSAQSARAARTGRQGAGGLERPDDRRAGAGRGRSTSRATVQRPLRAADFILRQHAPARRPAAAHLAHRPGQVRRLSRRLRRLANALVTLYEATFDERWIDEAVRLADIMLTHFADSGHGGFFYTADDHEQLIARHKDIQDSAVPSGNALAATALVRLGKLTGRAEYLEAAATIFRMASGLIERAPTATGQMLVVLEMLLGPTARDRSAGKSWRTRHRRRVAQCAAAVPSQ